MLNENAKKWTEALRSGSFKQATGHLCKVDDAGKRTYCCLGVACVLYQEAHPDARMSEIEELGVINFATRHYELPKVV